MYISLIRIEFRANFRHLPLYSPNRPSSSLSQILKTGPAQHRLKPPPFQNLSLSPPPSPSPMGGDQRAAVRRRRRAAEIVMVLAALGEMRGGRDPTPAERALAAEARGLLVQLCAGLKPRDLVSGDAVRGLVEDLGLREGRGDRRLSIAEKLLITKKKMEESELSTLHSSQPLPPSAKVQDEYVPSKASSTSAQSTSNTTVEPCQESNTSQFSHQLPVSEGMQTSVGQIVPENLLIGQQSSPDKTNVHATLYFTNHNDITKKVESVLQQKVSDHSIQTPPSIDFMNKPLSCQVCKNIISDMDTLLICDACEEGTHLKCLQPFGNKLFSKNDWYCPKCVLASNGKSFPPKYGRVTRSIGTSKACSDTHGAHVPVVKRAENLDAVVDRS